MCALMTRSLRFAGVLLCTSWLLSACHKDSVEPDPYAAVQGEWVYTYSTYDEYNAANMLLTRTNSGKAYWGPALMRCSSTDIVNYQTYSLRHTIPVPYTRTKDVLTLNFPATYTNIYVAPNSPRTIVGVPGDSLVLRWRTPEAIGTASAYRVVEDHFGRR